jgi:integrase/recombinase XerD
LSQILQAGEFVKEANPAPQAPPIAAGDRSLIEGFLERIWSELGLADNTLSGYRNDLEQFAAWLAAQQPASSLGSCRRDELFAYLAARSQPIPGKKRGYSARSTARLLSALRHFYRLLQRDGQIAEDPTLLVDAPKLPRSLPKALAESEVESLLRAPPDTALGLRDRAMLELMYATGLRVSELVGLRADQVNLRQGVLRVTGKGGKERLVPIGELAADWLQRYLGESRPLLVKGARVDALFRDRTSRRHDPANVLDPGQEACAGRGYRQPAHLAACAAPFLCHSFAEPRRRLACPADAARTQLPVDHPDLHPGGQGRTQAPAPAASSAWLRSTG